MIGLLSALPQGHTEQLILIGTPYPKSNHDILDEPFILTAPCLKNDHKIISKRLWSYSSRFFGLTFENS
jgi:hypothetical protein